MLDGEEKIIRSAIRGESSAFGELYDHYHPQIYRFVLVKVTRREEAEDLTHQVFLNAWQNIGSYKHLGHPFSSWLYQIARNLVIDHYRTKKPDVPLDDVTEDRAPIGGNTEARTDVRLELQKVMEVLAKLKPSYQDIILMRFVEELSLKEVAAAIGKSEGAVKLLQHRAVRQLKQELGRE